MFCIIFKNYIWILITKLKHCSRTLQFLSLSIRTPKSFPINLHRTDNSFPLHTEDNRLINLISRRHTRQTGTVHLKLYRKIWPTFESTKKPSNFVRTFLLLINTSTDQKCRKSNGSIVPESLSTYWYCQWPGSLSRSWAWHGPSAPRTSPTPTTWLVLCLIHRTLTPKTPHTTLSAASPHIVSTKNTEEKPRTWYNREFTSNTGRQSGKFWAERRARLIELREAESAISLSSPPRSAFMEKRAPRSLHELGELGRLRVMPPDKAIDKPSQKTRGKERERERGSSSRMRVGLCFDGWHGFV